METALLDEEVGELEAIDRQIKRATRPISSPLLENRRHCILCEDELLFGYLEFPAGTQVSRVCVKCWKKHEKELPHVHPMGYYAGV